MKRATVLWALAALVGLALTAGVTWAASNLVSQRIGLSSEPLSVADGLGPRGATTVSTSSASSRTTSVPVVTKTVTVSRTTTTSAPAVTRTVTVPSASVTTTPVPVVTHTVTAQSVSVTTSPAPATRTTTTGYGGHHRHSSDGSQRPDD